MIHDFFSFFLCQMCSCSFLYIFFVCRIMSHQVLPHPSPQCSHWADFTAWRQQQQQAFLTIILWLLQRRLQRPVLPPITIIPNNLPLLQRVIEMSNKQNSVVMVIIQIIIILPIIRLWALLVRWGAFILTSTITCDTG